MQAQRIYETCLCGDDLPAMQSFYTEVMGLKVLKAFLPRGIAFQCGDGVLIVFNAHEASQPVPHADQQFIPPHGTTGTGHMAFAATAEELPAWRSHLAQHRVPIISEMTWDNGCVSIYFNDPAGNLLELAPPGLWN